jgi:ATP-dependent exoDNAse (exonuclease V) beta subunit
VLTRTTNALRDVAVACAARGVKITGPESLFETRGAMETLEAYLHVLTGPKKATPEQVGIILKRPSRSLGRDAARLIAEQLRAGRTIAQAVDALRIEDRQRTRRDVLRDLLVRLAAFKEAGDFIGQLRASGLDAFYEERQAAFGAPDDDQLAVLAEAQQEAAGMTPLEYLEALQERRAGLQGVRDDRHGIELTTVHRSKGRQWPRVIIWSCEEGVMPHTRSLQVSDEQRAAGEGLEAERRIAYVAFTRAQQELSILHRSGRHSRFLNEAKLVAQPATLAQPSAERPDSRAGFWAQRANGAAARSATPTSGSTAARRRSQAEPPELSTALANGRRIGLSYALRTAKDGAAARAVAAHVLRRNLFGEMAAGQNMSFTEIVRAMDEVTPATQREMLRAMPAGNIDTPARQLTATDRQRAADIIETTPDAGGDRRADDPNSDIPY